MSRFKFEEFELIQGAEPTEEELLKKVHDGHAASELLIASGKLLYKGNRLYSEGWRAEDYTLFQQPRLIPFTLPNSQYAVRLENSHIYVGCHRANLKHLKLGLNALLFQNQSEYAADLVGVYIKATKDGIWHSKGTLTWADAELLYYRIKDLP